MSVAWVQPNHVDPDQNELWSMYLPPRVCIVDVPLQSDRLRHLLQSGLLLARDTLNRVIAVDESVKGFPIVYISRLADYRTI